MKIIDVPEQFQPLNRHIEPFGNETNLDEYVFGKLTSDIKTDYSYLPVFWTTYQFRSSYGHDPIKMTALQDFVCSIKEPWFTVVQYDGSIMIDRNKITVPHVVMCAGGGCDTDIPLPLARTAWLKAVKSEEKYFASFVGNMKTEACNGKPEPITTLRNDMVDALQGKEGYYFRDTSKMSWNEYGVFQDVMLSSKFSLCPRGSGWSSYRLYESLQMGTIPVYISNKFWLPFEKYLNWNDICVFIKPEQVKDIDKTLRSIPQDKIDQMSLVGQQAWKEFFSLDATVKTIIRIMENEYANA